MSASVFQVTPADNEALGNLPNLRSEDFVVPGATSLPIDTSLVVHRGGIAPSLQFDAQVLFPPSAAWSAAFSSPSMAPVDRHLAALAAATTEGRRLFSRFFEACVRVDVTSARALDAARDLWGHLDGVDGSFGLRRRFEAAYAVMHSMPAFEVTRPARSSRGDPQFICLATWRPNAHNLAEIQWALAEATSDVARLWRDGVRPCTLFVNLLQTGGEVIAQSVKLRAGQTSVVPLSRMPMQEGLRFTLSDNLGHFGHREITARKRRSSTVAKPQPA